MSVAIVIVNYNSGLLLEKCLQSLAEQTCPPDRIIVVDNHSDDADSLAILDEISNADVIRLDENLGYGGAINHAAKTLTGFDYVCSLNPDAYPEPDWLERLLDAADRHPEYGSYASLMLKADDPRIVDGAGDVLHFSGIPWRRFHGRDLEKIQNNSEPVFSPCGGAALYRLNAFFEVGGFDETFFMYVEDIDLGFRLQLAGYPCWYVHNAVVHHVGSATTGADSDFTLYHGHRNLVLSYLKNMPPLLLILTLPFLLIADVWTILVYLLRGKSLTILKAKRDAYRLAGTLLRHRQWRKRVVSNFYIWRCLQKWPLR